MTAFEAKRASEKYRYDLCIEQLLMDVKNHTLQSDVEFIICHRDMNTIQLSAMKRIGYTVTKLPSKPLQYKISWESPTIVLLKK